MPPTRRYQVLRAEWACWAVAQVNFEVPVHSCPHNLFQLSATASGSLGKGWRGTRRLPLDSSVRWQYYASAHSICSWRWAKFWHDSCPHERLQQTSLGSNRLHPLAASEGVLNGG